MRKSNDIDVVDKYLFEHWEDITKLQEAIEKLKTKIGMLAGEAQSSLKEQKWWTEEFQIETTSNGIEVFKRTWKIGKEKWDFVSMGFWGLSLEALMGTSEYPPQLYVWGEKLKERKMEFRKKFENYSRESRSSKDIKMSGKENDNYPLRIYPSYTPQEWIEIIKTGRFEEEITENFNKFLAPLIGPIDRALADVMKKKGKK